jgi:asparagine synthetase B (glutamine-hydrolysing)
MGDKVEQPLETSQGVLLYNGSVYNWMPENDTQHVAANLSNDAQQCVEFIRTLDGEYSLTWVTDQFVVFCTDTFGTRPLWFHHYSEGGIHTASLPDVFRSPQMRCEPNVIYVYHRLRDRLEMNTNISWDLSQHVDSWDATWQAFDRAVMHRHDHDVVYSVSGGYDSGSIMASAEKQFGEILCVNVIPNGEHEILSARSQINPIQLVSYENKRAEVDQRQLLAMTLNQEMGNTMATRGQTAYIRKFMKPHSRKVLITGDGGDEIYSDYGISGKPIRHHSKTGGHFPRDLATAWPWHDHEQVLSKYVGRSEAVGGYWGVELRLPMLDRGLVQAWINTSHRLKNSEYKGWMAQYMRDHRMPFDEHTKAGFGEVVDKPIDLS